MAQELLEEIQRHALPSQINGPGMTKHMQRYLLHSAALQIRKDEILHVPALTAPLPHPSQSTLMVLYGNHIVDAVYSALKRMLTGVNK